MDIDTTPQGFAEAGAREWNLDPRVGDQSYDMMEIHETIKLFFDQNELFTGFNQSYDEWVAELAELPQNRGYVSFQDPVVDTEHVKLYVVNILDPIDNRAILSEAFDEASEKAIGYWYDNQVLSKKVLGALEIHLNNNIVQIEEALALDNFDFDSETIKTLKFTMGRSFDFLGWDKDALRESLREELANQGEIKQLIQKQLRDIDSLELDVIKSTWLGEYKSPPNFLMDNDIWGDRKQDIRFKFIKSEYMCMLRGKLKLDGVRNGVSHGTNITKALKDCIKQSTSRGCSTSLNGYIPERRLYYKTILEAVSHYQRRYLK